jgi:hypothetical protein
MFCVVVAVAFAVFTTGEVQGSEFNTIVPEQQFVQATSGCNMNVKACFAHVKKESAPVWKKPVSDFSGSYKTMCSAEITVKLSEKSEKKKAEAKHKALCKKSEKDQKFLEKRLKLTITKEKYSKSVGEGKEKYFTKKLAHAKEVTVKTAGKGKEFAHKLSEKSNKREDVLYKKECKSKEMAFKAVREGKQKMKIVYVNKLPKKAKKAKKKATKHHKKVVKKHHKKVVKKHHKKVVKKVVHKVHPKVVVKKKTHKKKKLHVSSLKEVLIKTGEQSHKAQLKSQELMQKSNSEGKMAVVKEEIEKHHEKKSKHSTSGAVSKKEKKCKERDAKEDKAKSEIKTKLAVEKVKRENAGKESKSKIVKPKPAKPCNPVTALEIYVKKCKKKEEKFAKAKISHEAQVKEIKLKNKQHEEAKICNLVHKTCKEIYSVSSLREDHVVKLVREHTKELEGAMAKTEKFQAEEAARMKFSICESAAKDMKYFVNKLLYTMPHKDATAKVAAQEA